MSIFDSHRGETNMAGLEFRCDAESGHQINKQQTNIHAGDGEERGERKHAVTCM